MKMLLVGGNGLGMLCLSICVSNAVGFQTSNPFSDPSKAPLPPTPCGGYEGPSNNLLTHIPGMPEVLQDVA